MVAFSSSAAREKEEDETRSAEGAEPRGRAGSPSPRPPAPLAHSRLGKNHLASRVDERGTSSSSRRSRVLELFLVPPQSRPLPPPPTTCTAPNQSPAAPHPLAPRRTRLSSPNRPHQPQRVPSSSDPRPRPRCLPKPKPTPTLSSHARSALPPSLSARVLPTSPAAFLHQRLSLPPRTNASHPPEPQSRHLVHSLPDCRRRRSQSRHRGFRALRRLPLRTRLCPSPCVPPLLPGIPGAKRWRGPVSLGKDLESFTKCVILILPSLCVLETRG